MKFRKILLILAGAIAGCLPAQGEPGAWGITDHSQRRAIAGAIFRGVYPAPQPAAPSSGESFSAMAFTSPEATEISPEIKALARGLKNDAWSILQYCNDRIRHECYWGSKKGSTLTLLEGSGNSFDTSALMVALLRESGYQDVNFRYGLRIFDETQLEDWLGLISFWDFDGAPFPEYSDAQVRQMFNLPANYPLSDTDRFALHKLDFLTMRGFPYVQEVGDGTYKVPHVWVTFRDAQGVMREVDPSFKYLDRYYFETPSVATFGYDRTTFLGNLGGSLADAGRQISGIGVTTPNGLNNQLSSFTNQFRTWLRNNWSDASTDDFVNRGYPSPIEGVLADHYLAAGADYDAASTTFPPTSWDEIPSQWQTKITFYASLELTHYKTITLRTNSLAGKKLSLSSAGTTVTLRSDEETIISFTTSLAAYPLKIEVDHPNGYYDANGQFVDDGTADTSEEKSYIRSDTTAYAIIYGFDPSAEHLRKSQERLDKYRKAGLADNSWQVRTESLNVIGLNWLLQCNLVDKIAATRTKVIPLANHHFGRVSQESSFFIDVGLSHMAPLSYSGRASTRMLHFHVTNYFASALEHGILEQSQGPSVNAISTVRAFQLANAQGAPLHLADSSNWASVRSLLESSGNGWSVATLNSIATQIGGSGAPKVLIPRRGNIGMSNPPAVGSWRGYGYALNSDIASGYFISGGYSGGYSSNPGSVSSDFVSYYSNTQPGYYLFKDFFNGSSGNSTVPIRTGADPVDMATGAFLFGKTDLQLGGGELPRGISFHRSYNSNRSADDSQRLGNGWTHNLHIEANRRSAARAALGDATVEQMAATYVAVAVALDVYANKANAKDWAATALTAGWGVDQLRENGVSIAMGAQTIEFVKMPDGAYVPPAGITMTLLPGTALNSVKLVERHGNTYNFAGDTGKLITVHDQHNKTATFTYSDLTINGKQVKALTKVTDCYGRELTLGWAGGHISSVVEFAGTAQAGYITRQVSFGYTGNNLTTAWDPEGKSFGYGYDQDRISSLVDGRGRTITANFYDEQDRVYEQHLHGDLAKTFKLFISGYRNIERNPQGAETTYVYDHYGRSVGKIDALGNEDYTAYDGQNRKVQFAEPGNNLPGGYRPTRLTYNADHNLTEVRLPKRSATDPNSFYLATNEYDSEKRLWKESDYKGNKTIYTYTAKHQVETITDRKGQLVQTNTYDANGYLETVKDGANKITKYLNYDAFGNARTIEYPPVVADGVTVTPTEVFLYDARGSLLEYTDRNGNKTTTTYNKRREPRVVTLAAVDGISHTSEIQYDDAGNPYRTKDANGNWTETDTSPTGKLLVTQLPPTSAGMAETQHKYDAADRLEWTKDVFGRKSTFGYDLVGRLTTATDALSRTATSVYDENGRIKESIDFRNKSTYVRYNWRGEIYQMEDALAHESTTALDANGAGDSLTNKRGKLFDFGYDNNGRPASIKTPLLKEQTTGWTIRGQVDYIQEASTDRTEFGYDDMGRVNQVAYKQGVTTVATVAHARDKQGNIKKLTEGTRELSYTYDERNRIRSFTDVRGKTIGYRYDGNGNLTQLIYPDGKGSVFYTWTPLNQLEKVTDWSGRETRYFYDLAGRLIRVERQNGTQRRVSYDAVSQLKGINEISATGQPLFFSHHRYDGGGRRERETLFPSPHAFTAPSFSAIYDDDNRLATFNGIAVVHDNDGNMTTGPLGGVSSSTFVYDSRNRLTSAGGLTYSYDPAGNRTSVTSGAGETKWTIDPAGSLSRALVREKPDGTKTWYIYGLGLLYEVNQAGTGPESTTTYHSDSRGSTVVLTAGDGQTVVDRIEYDAWGAETWSQSSFDTPFLYHGAFGVQTDVNGLCHMRARYYSPQIRRFLNADPLGFDGGSNWYQFAAGNPLAFADPLGLAALGYDSWGQYYDEAVESISGTAIGLLEGLSGGVVGPDPLLVMQMTELERNGYHIGLTTSLIGSFFAPKATPTSGRSIPMVDDVIYVTPEGVALPPGGKYKIPDRFTENPHRSGSYGEIVEGKYVERLRIDPATPPGKKGPNYSHYHLDGEGTHYSSRPGNPDPGFPK